MRAQPEQKVPGDRFKRFFHCFALCFVIVSHCDGIAGSPVDHYSTASRRYLVGAPKETFIDQRPPQQGIVRVDLAQ